ncbi:MAG TPA: sulfur carrier protein ThiS adenylyltransferase ThiF [Candidatus Nanoarchaeia archaeon]|nr:sulfur carrier protein ThiS adenylyltransferase ThiF [Candidatus Nanoarchaeia archaeon]
MNEFDKTARCAIGNMDYPRLNRIKIGIAGAGGLGSNCALNLVRSGFKKLKIVDFDKVEFSNLNRQFYFYEQVGKEKIEALKENLLKINPDLELDMVNARIDAGNVACLFEDCDVIAEGLDSAEDKKMLVERMLAENKFVVSASGICGYGKCDDIKVHHLMHNLAVVGDLKTSTDCRAPISPRVNIVAAKQADIILSYVMGNLDGKK